MEFSWDSSVGTATRYWLGGPGSFAVGNYHVQTPVKWVAGAISPEIKRTGPETYHRPASSVEVNKMWSYTSTPPRLHGVCKSKAVPVFNNALRHEDVGEMMYRSTFLDLDNS
jgi:hypothetical protein